jgi:hypothetical protein
MLISSFFSGKFTPEYFTTQAQDFSSLMASGKDFEHHYLAEFNDMWQKIGVGGGIGTNYFLVDFKSFVSGMPFDEFLKILKYDGMTTNQKGFDSRLSEHKLKARKNEKNRAVDFVCFLL